MTQGLLEIAGLDGGLPPTEDALGALQVPHEDYYLVVLARNIEVDRLHPHALLDVACTLL